MWTGIIWSKEGPTKQLAETHSAAQEYAPLS